MALSTLRRRRWSAVPAIALAALIALTGCAPADDTEEAGGGDPAASALPAGEGTTQYPLTLTTWAGESVLEQRPERVAVIGFSPNYDALEVLGVTPVYAQGEESEWPWRDQAWLSEIEFTDTATRRDPINFEGIASTNPDLIVAVNYIQDEVDFERLSTIAPVLENPEQVPGDQIRWQDTQRLIGEALDLSAASDRVVTEAEQAIDAVGQANPQFAGRTITIATDYAETGIEYLTATGSTAEGVIRRMGFAPNPLAENFVAERKVADEQIGSLDADVLVMFYFTEEAGRAEREQNPLFRSLPAVAENRYVSLLADDPGSEITWVLRRGASASSLPWTVEVLADRVNQVDLT
ncbi:ABC transporter substrate-binding protein [Pseudonocardia sp. NPDC049635]|uniref:ABC transporter substrate-binding protein n=1 Tax=Pseudonocardia sp. NPDC049635 TaxID=3155506 RepID=UPI0033E42879